MMVCKKWLTVSVTVSALVAFSGCVQYPTERQGVVDLRPQISFRVDPANTRMTEARVLIDGLDSGRLGDFVDGKGALQVLSGSHVIQVVSGSEFLLNESTYLGDGVARPFTVK